MNSLETTPPDPPLPPLPPVPDTPSDFGLTWEDEETSATLVLRALFAMVAGGVLLFAQFNSPYFPPSQFWSRWIWTSVLFNFVVPLLLVWMFFGQGLVHLDWLKNQKHNAWNYGWNWKRWKRHALFALSVTAVMSIFMWFASRDPAVRVAYNTFLPTATTTFEWVWVLATLVVYMFCWEWCFRGFLLFGTAQGFGWVVAVGLQAIMFGFAHTGKPPVEFWTSFLGGGALGVICWREKSFVPAFFVHALVQVVWSVMVRV